MKTKFADPNNNWRLKYSEDRREFITIRCNKAQKEGVTKIAHEAGMTVNEFIRQYMSWVIEQESE